MCLYSFLLDLMCVLRASLMHLQSVVNADVVQDKKKKEKASFRMAV